jgi:hypothetical protein
VNPTPSVHRVQLEPAAARAANMLTQVVGQPRAVVSHFVLEVDGGVQLKATPAELDQVLADFRGHSNEQPEAYLSRLAQRLRGCFK